MPKQSAVLWSKVLWSPIPYASWIHARMLLSVLRVIGILEGVDLVDMRHRWVWSLEGSGEFTTDSVRRLIDEHWLPKVLTKTRWINVVLIKVNVHAWKVRHDEALRVILNIKALGVLVRDLIPFKISHENVGYSLRRIPRGGIEQVQFLEFLASMKGVDLVDIRDRWVWSLEGSGEFTAASVRRLINERWLPEVLTKTRWINVVLIKVNVHA
ncbi:hypothetical protein Tco_0496063 [Tanacetum coccineum]